MTSVLRSRQGMLAAGAAALALVLVAGWFLVVSPKRTRADELKAEVAAAQSELAQKRAELARPSCPGTRRMSSERSGRAWTTSLRTSPDPISRLRVRPCTFEASASRRRPALPLVVPATGWLRRQTAPRDFCRPRDPPVVLG